LTSLKQSEVTAKKELFWDQYQSYKYYLYNRNSGDKLNGLKEAQLLKVSGMTTAESMGLL